MTTEPVIVQIFCAGRKTTATWVTHPMNEDAELGNWRCDHCGNRIRRVFVWDDQRHLSRKHQAKH